ATVASDATAPAGTPAVNCVELTTVVAGVVPPKLTTEAATKFVPLTVRVKPAPPAAALVGEIVAIVGLVIVGLLPPHPARNTRLTTPWTASLLMSPVLLFTTTSRFLPRAIIHGPSIGIAPRAFCENAAAAPLGPQRLFYGTGTMTVPMP